MERIPFEERFIPKSTLNLDNLDILSENSKLSRYLDKIPAFLIEFMDKGCRALVPDPLKGHGCRIGRGCQLPGDWDWTGSHPHC